MSAAEELQSAANKYNTNSVKTYGFDGISIERLSCGFAAPTAKRWDQHIDFVYMLIRK